MKGNTIELPLIDVEVDRGKEVLTVAIPEHEIRVLQHVHGGDKVRKAPKQEGDTGDFSISADAEYDRLVRKYRRVNAPDMVRQAYPNGAQQLEQFGFELGRDGDSAPPTSVVKKHRKAVADGDAGEGKPDKPAKQDKPDKPDKPAK